MRVGALSRLANANFRAVSIPGALSSVFFESNSGFPISRQFASTQYPFVSPNLSSVIVGGDSTISLTLQMPAHISKSALLNQGTQPEYMEKASELRTSDVSVFLSDRDAAIELDTVAIMFCVTCW